MSILPISCPALGWPSSRPHLPDYISLERAQGALVQSGNFIASVPGSIKRGAYRSGEAALQTLHSCYDNVAHQYERLKYAAEQTASSSVAVIAGQTLHQGICVGIPTLMREALAFNLSKALSNHPTAAYATLAASSLVSIGLLVNSRYQLTQDWRAFDPNRQQPIDILLAQTGLSQELQAAIDHEVSTAAPKRIKDFDYKILTSVVYDLTKLGFVLAAYLKNEDISFLVGLATLEWRNLAYSLGREILQSLLDVSRNKTASKFDMAEYPTKNVFAYASAVTASGIAMDLHPNSGSFERYALRAAFNTVPELLDDLLIRYTEKAQNPGSQLAIAPRLNFARLIGKHPSIAIPGQSLPNRLLPGDRLRDQVGSRSWFFKDVIFKAIMVGKFTAIALPISKLAGKNPGSLAGLFQRTIAEPVNAADINKTNLLISIGISNLAVGVSIVTGLYNLVVSNWVSTAISRGLKVKVAQQQQAVQNHQLEQISAAPSEIALAQITSPIETPTSLENPNQHVINIVR